MNRHRIYGDGELYPLQLVMHGFSTHQEGCLLCSEVVARQAPPDDLCDQGRKLLKQVRNVCDAEGFGEAEIFIVSEVMLCPLCEKEKHEAN
jgi:hypothetical protein